MTTRPIRHFGDPVLKAPTAEVVTIDDDIRSLVRDLVDSVELPGRAGVAATQIGVGLRVFSYNVDGVIGYLINPKLVEVRGELEEIGEGCLSVPGLWFPTPRHPYARAVGIDLDGQELVVEGEGLLAQALQHETDHLDGMLYLDRLSKEHRREAMKQVRESDWF
ncbi:peptide deformylase [Plantibacter sp. VKM Ac-2885]|uniref:Peptide deformylase n=2 Tax=Plantibacter TaxID=190323 RepID=A0ABY1LNZ2_9MICO|nr:MULTISPECIES: peptide deformylase [Plantibacter]MBD8103143.1 peptide deformylase [Plantibacter sp. CFBP 8775]MBD8466136.1 peptide deformylase [Plantibacter sp. CFBP 8798]MBD8515386.1 peptide deformylase [Plantibacter sp. CFBP 8804]MBF4513199.1 peptide deformylase [Plantibacter sp. VKM Ac-2885]MBF4564797.1 peptide deformylase [Plantibacter sp. VKM Ac-2876]NUJ86430.1 peptide deformylase [Plantibacter sp. MCCC 1A11337]